MIWCEVQSAKNHGEQYKKNTGPMRRTAHGFLDEKRGEGSGKEMAALISKKTI